MALPAIRAFRLKSSSTCGGGGGGAVYFRNISSYLAVSLGELCSIGPKDLKVYLYI